LALATGSSSAPAVEDASEPPEQPITRAALVGHSVASAIRESAQKEVETGEAWGLRVFMKTPRTIVVCAIEATAMPRANPGTYDLASSASVPGAHE
jgi:hypothetical protein